jgi:VanZ family protein
MKWMAVLFGVFIIGIIILANMGLLDILGFVNAIPYGDKAGHFILYGILTFLIDRSFLPAKTGNHSPALEPGPKLIVLRIALILALLIGLEEFSQRYFENRTSDWVDLLFSFLGVAFFSWLALRKK